MNYIQKNWIIGGAISLFIFVVGFTIIFKCRNFFKSSTSSNSTENTTPSKISNKEAYINYKTLEDDDLSNDDSSQEEKVKNEVAKDKSIRYGSTEEEGSNQNGNKNNNDRKKYKAKMQSEK